MQIETTNRAREAMILSSAFKHDVHFVSEKAFGSEKKTQNSLKVQKNGKNSKNIKKNRLYFHCGKKGHYIREYRFKNEAKKSTLSAEN